MLLSILLIGVSLSMDAFAVSVTNGLTLKNFNFRHALWMGLYFGGFQFLMPLLGCLLGSTVSHYVMRFGPYISFALLGFIGGKMVLEGIRHPAEEEEEEIRLAGGTLLLQGVATSIDALSVGFTIASYGVMKALTASALIGLTTLVICLAGLRIGRYFGMRLAGKASVLGGVILIAIGIRILAGGL